MVKSGGETYPIDKPKHKIDYIYTSNNLLNRIIQCSKSTIQSDISEDHCSLWVSIELQANINNQPMPPKQNKPRLNIKNATKENWELFKTKLDKKIST